MSEKVCTQQELEEMGALTLDLIIKAIDDDDKERAKKLSNRMYREFLAMHDLYRDWVTALLSFISRRYGDEVLDQAYYESCAIYVKPLVELYRGADIRKKIHMAAAAIKGHLQSMKIEEDEEKFTIIQQVCGSGGRQILEGSYDGPPKDFVRIKRPQAMTYGREGFPIYCAHCAVMAQVTIDEAGALIRSIVDPSEKPGEVPCRIYLYKDLNAIPTEFYRRVGRKKRKES